MAARAIRVSLPASRGPRRWPARTKRWSAPRESRIMNMPASVAREAIATGAMKAGGTPAPKARWTPLVTVLIQGQADQAARGEGGGEHDEHRGHGGQQHPQDAVAAPLGQPGPDRGVQLITRAA